MSEIKENTTSIESIEDMASYFSNVRDFFINSPSIWMDNFYINSIIVRAHQINKGFIALTDSANYLCAAPLVRMQLETLCRLYGAYIADGDSYVLRYMKGQKLDNQTYNGKQLTYTTLVQLLADAIGAKELPRIYSEGNKFIHPTDVAFKAAVWSEGKNINSPES